MVENGEELFNLRDWLEAAITEKGAKVTGKGAGMNGADLWFELEGVEFFISCSPVFRGGRKDE